MEIDVTHPSVQKLLGVQEPDGKPRLASRKKLVHVAGDQDSGMLATARLDAGKIEVLTFYRAKDLWMTVDVYLMPGEPPKIHFLCPKCRNALSIPATKKRIEFEATEPNPLYRAMLETPPADWDPEDVAWLRQRGLQGRLSTDTFMCTWENPNLRNDLCRWRAVFDNNVVKEA